MKYKILILLIIIIPSLLLSQYSDYYPYLYNVINNNITKVTRDLDESPLSAHNVLYWYDLRSSKTQYNHIALETDWLDTDYQEYQPPNGFSDNDYKTAIINSMNAWNDMLTGDNEAVFFEKSCFYSNVLGVAILPIITWEEYGYELNVIGKAVFACEQIPYTEYESPWGITYYNENYQTQPGWQWTMISMNSDPSSADIFTWIDGEPDFYEDPPEKDLQFEIMHELGHVIGFADDTDTGDIINTVMTQNSLVYWSRTVEIELINTFTLMYDVEKETPGLPQKETNNEK